MNIETFREFCLSFPETTEEFPFDENTLVFKVAGKMFALCDVDEFESINLKCDPDEALILRDRYEEVVPGYHMNKKHWNTVSMQSNLPDKLLREWIETSYRLVLANLRVADRKRIEEKLSPGT
jgi:predicted DNA-binding protein (MmcQ/YjbR family)